jgi:predicted metal-dependent hydrolase
MNKTVGLKAKNTSSKGKINGGTKRPTLASLLAQQTPEKKAALEKQMYEKLGIDAAEMALYDDIETNRAEIIERNKLTWEHIKALQDAWREVHGPYDENLKNDLTK